MGGLKCSRLKYKLLFRTGVCASRLNSRDQWKSGLKMEIRMLYYYFFECKILCQVKLVAFCHEHSMCKWHQNPWFIPIGKMIMFICDRFIRGPPGLASLQCILCSWLSQNSFWNLWRFQGDSLSTLRVVVSYTVLYKGKLEKNIW